MFPRCRALWWATLTSALFLLLQPDANGPIPVSRQATKNYVTSKNKIIFATQDTNLDATSRALQYRHQGPIG
jgi:hypothetical protein